MPYKKKKPHIYCFKKWKARTISALIHILKLLQKCLNVVLNIIFVPHKAANGFVVNHDNKIRNIVTNAQIHTNKPYVYNIDLSDFFTSIAFRRIKTVLQLAPFNLPDDIAFLVANLCSDNGVLPQGAPTSPTLTNAVCQRLDRKLTAFAKTNKIRYTRYADDITFSGYENIFNEEFYNQLKNIVEIEESFKINESKVRLQTRNDRQEVTGLTVNEKVNVEQRYIRSIRAMLHNWQNKGLEYATTKFRECYVKEKGAKRVIPPFESVLRMANYNFTDGTRRK
ncbi:MAG: RNA-directed DNA polymerase [Sphingobacteriales bacterium]|nr:RNA-directed DNA polymerase [Sphingobacteriales bacterium]